MKWPGHVEVWPGQGSTPTEQRGFAWPFAGMALATPGAMGLKKLTDDELLASLRSTCLDARKLVAHIIHHLNEIESRQIHVRAACKSMFVFCTTRLGMSEGEAFRRLTAARLMKKFPVIRRHLERG